MGNFPETSHEKISAKLVYHITLYISFCSMSTVYTNVQCNDFHTFLYDKIGKYPLNHGCYMYYTVMNNTVHYIAAELCCVTLNL